MNRRKFLFTGSAGLSAATLLYLTGCGLGGNSHSPSTLALIWDPETIVDVGKKYRATFPTEDSRETLTDLLSDLSGKENETVAKDEFTSGRTVQIDGWIISLTEARQCALASLNS